MDLNIDLTKYNLVDINNIEYIDKTNNFIDITVEQDHTLYINNDNTYILAKQCDGSHIAGLYIGFLFKYAPSLIKNKQLCRLKTPIVCLKDKSGKIKKLFFNLDEYKNYEKNNTDKSLVPHYYKGLGSWKPNDLRELIKQYGLEYFVEILEYDEKTDEIIHKWLDGKEAESRKEFLRKYAIDLDKI